MSDNVNHLRWQATFSGYSHNPISAWVETQRRAQATHPRLPSVQVGLGNLSFTMNPLRQYTGPQGRHIHAPPASVPPAFVPPASVPPASVPPTYLPPACPPPAHAPHTPHACPYIRPAIDEDAEEITQILNWHTSISPFDPEYEPMEPEWVCNFLEACKQRKLPFLVLVRPPDLSQISQEPPKSNICGLTYVDTFVEDPDEDSLGDLRVYICPGMTRHGYGTMLLDSILSICDENYRRRFSVEWRPVGDVELQVLRLKKLVCAVPYAAQVERNYVFTWHWLKNRFNFKDFGEVRQDRAKYGYEESYYCVYLLINSAGRLQQRQIPRRYQ